MMNLRTERSEMLPSSFLGLQNRAPSTATSTSLLRAEDKGSIYTFSDNCSSDNDDNNYLDNDKFNSKYGSRLNMPSSQTPTDRNLNETRPTLKDNVRTYGKKKSSSSSSVSSKSSLSDPRRRQAASSTMPTADTNTPSGSPYQTNQPITFSPPSNDGYGAQLMKSNGNMFAGTNSICFVLFLSWWKYWLNW